MENIVRREYQKKYTYWKILKQIKKDIFYKNNFFQISIKLVQNWNSRKFDRKWDLSSFSTTL